MKTLIKNLTEISAPSGYESKIRQFIQKEVQNDVDHIYTDALGNLITMKNGATRDCKKIMLIAHMDEIGVIASHIDARGYIRFTTLGGVKPVNCVGGRIRFINNVCGVIATEKVTNTTDIPKIDQMFIDVGAVDRDSCPIRIGDVAAFDRPFVDFGQRIVSKALDDRIGVAILIETIKKVTNNPHQIFFVFSAQEEVGVRGATTASYGIEPDMGIAVDVTATGDTPRGLKMDIQLGKGPAIKIRDSGMLADPRIISWMEITAKKNKIPYQLEILESGGTDASAIQVSRSGVPSGCLSIPCRYIHSPSEMVDIQDVENSIHLLVKLIQNPANIDHE
jgi:putative aminopeptidase FrvX